MREEQQRFLTLRHLPARVTAEDEVRVAAARMRELGIGFLPVCDRGGRMIGALTDRDIAVRLVAGHHGGDAARVRDGAGLRVGVLHHEVEACIVGRGPEEGLRVEAARRRLRREEERVDARRQVARELRVVDAGVDLDAREAQPVQDQHVTGEQEEQHHSLEQPGQRQCGNAASPGLNSHALSP